VELDDPKLATDIQREYSYDYLYRMFDNLVPVPMCSRIKEFHSTSKITPSLNEEVSQTVLLVVKTNPIT